MPPLNPFLGAPQRGHDFGLLRDTFFGVEAAEKCEKLGDLGEYWIKWHILGASGAENFEKFRYFSKKSPNFVKAKDFIS